MGETQDPRDVAEAWRSWCGDTPWSRWLDRFGELGGRIEWFCGLPKSASAIPLTFRLYGPDGSVVGRSRLKDIRESVRSLEGEGGEV